MDANNLVTQFYLVGKLKMKSSAEEFCINNAKVFTPVLVEYAYSLAFAECPDFSKITFMLKKSLIDMKKIPQFLFNWRASAVLQSLIRLIKDQFRRKKPAINENEYEFN